MSESPVHILCICTGNVCRSPAAERLLTRMLPPGAQVASAGTHALAGQPIWPPMATLLSGAGVDPTGFEARQLTPGMVRDADLVLAMSTEHRAAAVELSPAAVRKTFTLREFARLLRAVELDPIQANRLDTDVIAQQIRALIPRVAVQRRPVADQAANDVIDPYKRSQTVCRSAFEDINAAAMTIASVFAAPSHDWKEPGHQHR